MSHLFSDNKGENNFNIIYSNYAKYVEFNDIKQICDNIILTHDDRIIVFNKQNNKPKIYKKDLNIRKICTLDNDVLILYKTNKLASLININDISHDINILNEVIDIIVCNDFFIIITDETVYCLTTHLIYDETFELDKNYKNKYHWPYQLYKITILCDKDIISINTNEKNRFYILFKNKIEYIYIMKYNNSFKFCTIKNCLEHFFIHERITGKDIKKIIIKYYNVILLLNHGSIYLMYDITRITDGFQLLYRNIYYIWYYKRGIDLSILYIKYNGKIYNNDYFSFIDVKDDKIKSIRNYDFNCIIDIQGDLNWSNISDCKKYKSFKKDFNYIIDTQIDLKWSPLNHTRYSKLFQKDILKLLLCLKYYNKKNNLKIPKYITYMIIDFLRQSY